MPTAATKLPTLHEALMLADHASPTPASANGALRVLRAALADALTQTVDELIEASKAYEPDNESQLNFMFTETARNEVVSQLLNGKEDRVQVGKVALIRDRAMNLIWGRDSEGTETVAAVGIGPESCQRAAAWALPAWLGTASRTY